MSVAKQEQHDLDTAVYASRHEGRAIHTWLIARREELNTKWMNITGDELVALQGEARSVARLIKLMEQGPRIKQPEGSK